MSRGLETSSRADCNCMILNKSTFLVVGSALCKPVDLTPSVLELPPSWNSKPHSSLQVSQVMSQKTTNLKK